MVLRQNLYIHNIRDMKVSVFQQPAVLVDDLFVMMSPLNRSCTQSETRPRTLQVS